MSSKDQELCCGFVCPLMFVIACCIDRFALLFAVPWRSKVEPRTCKRKPKSAEVKPRTSELQPKRPELKLNSVADVKPQTAAELKPKTSAEVTPKTSAEIKAKTTELKPLRRAGNDPGTYCSLLGFASRCAFVCCLLLVPVSYTHLTLPTIYSV